MSKIHSLLCEYQDNPLALDTAAPLLSWKVDFPGQNRRVASWKILAATSPKKLAADEGDLWDSGIVPEEAAASTFYRGKVLGSRQRVWWKARAWDQDGNDSGWSLPQHFLTGLFSPEAWEANWIAACGGEPKEIAPFFRSGNYEAALSISPHEPEAVYLRREISILRRVVSAELSLCGLGYVDFFINGKKVGDQVLDPPPTAYDKRVQYRVFDVTKMLEEGSNALCAILGNGFYNMQTPDFLQMEKAPWRTPPKMIARLDISYDDGSTAFFGTDRQWTVDEGPIRFNCVRGGETIDLRKGNPAWFFPGFHSTTQHEPLEVSAPEGKLEPAVIPPIRVQERLQPMAITETDPGIYVADFGRNLAGWVRFRTRQPEGTRINLDFGEVLEPDGRFHHQKISSHVLGRYQHQECITAGRGDEIFEPRFTYYAFRYVEIRGLSSPPRPEDLIACRMHTDLPLNGQFECSNPSLNLLHEACRRTLEDCTFGSICSEPVREKVGWNGDTLFEMDAYMSLFDSVLHYRKHVRDCQDSQNPNGHIPPVFPTSGWGRLDADGNRYKCDDPWWGGSLADSVRGLHHVYGDLSTLQTTYKACRNYAVYVASSAKNHLVDWSLGDWIDANWTWEDGPGLTPVTLTSTLGYYRIVRMLEKQAKVLGMDEKAEQHGTWAEGIGFAFRKKFFNSVQNRFIKGSQTAPAVALSTGVLSPDQMEAAQKNLLEELEAASGHLTTGFIGTIPLLYQLVEAGRDDEAYRAVTKPTGSGWFWQLTGNNPTLAETIHPERAGVGTHHHQYSATIAGYLYRCLAGIRPDSRQPGFRHCFIRPPLIHDLEEVKASLETVRGRIEIHWVRKESEYRMELVIPSNMTAMIEFPAMVPGTLQESGKPVTESKRKGHEIGSGRYVYSFRLAGR